MLTRNIKINQRVTPNHTRARVACFVWWFFVFIYFLFRWLHCWWLLPAARCLHRPCTTPANQSLLEFCPASRAPDTSRYTWNVSIYMLYIIRCLYMIWFWFRFGRGEKKTIQNKKIIVCISFICVFVCTMRDNKNIRHIVISLSLDFVRASFVRASDRSNFI